MFKVLVLSLCFQFLYAFELVNRVVGGSDARLGELPYIVSIRGYNRHVCGGSIISQKLILTAAHCVHKLEHMPEIFSVQYGIIEITELYPNVLNVSKIIKHSGFIDDDEYPNDIALLELEKEIVYNRLAQAVQLPSPFQSPPADSQAILAGWGLNQTYGHIQITLQKVELLIFPEHICKMDPKYDFDIHICAGIPKGGKGQCTGDSGGPLVIDGIQYGIVSWSEKPCASPGHPGYFTKISAYRNWIRRKAEV